ncbi:hypothetical protein L21SP3_02127 [Sedimentisphaera cyanobacteriorum]|uniref:Beta-galactosidase trimerization domain protein n=1 Tax=Sedimentisphaera cyanobacteriorum TaxID=1940790 RepID=A0A1Q2HS56_9BACT|nr:hypothetical protein [Sedimentisphaera cyanobacteriorum]AQQ10298.1 hypothetical protein L21SP3_02127 [Sedimentisphaera cyanobacteriorum]
MKNFKILIAGLVLSVCTLHSYADNSVRLVTDRSLELTGFQDSRPYSPECDFRNDFAMVYGASRPDLIDDLKSWKQKDYLPHLMTGIAWGQYSDFEDFEGSSIMSLSQVDADGSQKLHGHMNPYIVPSIEFADYITEKLKTAIDAGVLAIHLEEPEFWAYTGFSEKFQKEWKLFYDEPFTRPDSSINAQYKASKLKYYLYTRTIRRVAEACKDYALRKHNRELRIYVPTHSLINYTHWNIVSPQSSLIDSDVIDGCIAQVWTGTSRTPNVYEGNRAERTFETAFLEYGVMQELVRNTDRRLWFLHDPIEDNSGYGWDDYKYNYKATLIASLLQPHIWRYEICPWPHRVFERSYPRGSENAKPIPADYATTLCTVFNQLRDMRQEENEWVNASHGIGVLIADSAMFQRAQPVFREAAGNMDNPKRASESEIEDFSAFYGLTLPLLKHGIPVQAVQLDNTVRFANYLTDYKVLVLSYEFMKPQTPAVNQALAEWTAQGGVLVYVGADEDPFNNVSEWWNMGDKECQTPSGHLLELMGIKSETEDGIYSFGEGKVFLSRKHPAYYSRSEKAADEYRSILSHAAKAAGMKYNRNNYLQLNRGPYVIAACLEDSISKKPLELEGLFVDLLDSNLPVKKKVSVSPGQRIWLMDLKKLEKNKAQPIASAARIESWEKLDDGIELKLSAPRDVKIVSRIRLPKKPLRMLIDNKNFADFSWHKHSKTVFFKSPAFEKIQSVKIFW